MYLVVEYCLCMETNNIALSEPPHEQNQLSAHSFCVYHLALMSSLNTAILQQDWEMLVQLIESEGRKSGEHQEVETKGLHTW